jgi:hypothetical protein
MRKLSIIAMLLVALMATSVSAYVDVTYHFNQQNVEIAAYDILNADGSNVGAFSGALLDGTTTNNGELTVRFPNSLASQYGYALYYVSDGYLPVEAIADWHSNGYGDAYTMDLNVNFEKLNSCRAVIDEFSVTNDAFANVPVVIDMDTSLDATLLSAFSLTDNDLEYIPTQFNEHYSADIEVTLRVFDQGNFIVETQTQAFSLLADSTQNVEFTWTPSLDGQYRAEIVTEVVDNQCSSSVPGTTEKEFTVLDAMPRDEYYTLMNSLEATPDVPIVGETVDVSYTKISNYANDFVHTDPSYTLTPVQTDITYRVQAPSGQLTEVTEILAANGNSVNPVSFTFGFVPQEAGLHTITVTGKAVELAGLTGKPNPSETLTLEVYVEDEPRHDVTFTIMDATTGLPISGAVVNIDGNYFQSDANGEVTVTGLPAGDYAYVITHPDYQTVSGILTITDFDVSLALTMFPGDGVTTPIPTTPVVDNLETGSNLGFHINSARIPNAYDQKAGDIVPFHFTFTNDGDDEMRNVKATVVVQELAVRKAVGPFDVDQGDTHSETLYFEIPENAAPGLYPVRITLDSEDASRRVIYREIEVTQ